MRGTARLRRLLPASAKRASGMRGASACSVRVERGAGACAARPDRRARAARDHRVDADAARARVRRRTPSPCRSRRPWWRNRRPSPASRVRASPSRSARSRRPRSISGSAPCTVRKTAVRLVRRMASKAAAVVLPSGVGPEMPALANTMSSEPKASPMLLEHRIDRGRSSRSACDAERVLAQFGDRLVQLRAIAARDHHTRAFCDQKLCRSEADAAVAARHERCFSGKTHDPSPVLVRREIASRAASARCARTCYAAQDSRRIRTITTHANTRYSAC